MVNVVKFSQFASVNLTNTTNMLVGVSSPSGGINFQQPATVTWTTAARPASPYDGLMGYNSSLSQWEYWNGSAWVQFGAGGSGSVNSGSINQLAYYAAGGTAVSGLDTANNGILITGATGVPSIASRFVVSNFPAGAMFNFQQGQLTTVFTTTSLVFANITGLDVVITPSSTSNKVLVRAVVQYCSVSQITYFQLSRNGTPIGIGTTVGSRTACGASGVSTAADAMETIVLEWEDSPASISALTYTVQVAAQNSLTISVNATITDTNSSAYPRCVSTISACEIQV